MSKLAVLRSRLSSLRRRRQRVRLGTAYSALVTAILWTLSAAFVIDLLFERQMSTPVRLVALLFYVGICVWAFRRYTLPLLGTSESDVDMALLVERQQLDPDHRDLVAAMQFESSPDAPQWGSRQLETAVVDYVAEFGRGVDVYQGFSREQLVRRATVLAVTAGIVLLVGAMMPRYIGVFLNRLALGSMHYPRDTVVDTVVVNQRTVLSGAEGWRPVDSNGAEGQPVTFVVLCRGTLPEEGELSLSKVHGGGGVSLPLKQIGLDERLARLQDARARIQSLLSIPSAERAQSQLDASSIGRLDALVRLDAPQSAAVLAKCAANPERLGDALAILQERIEAWPGDADQSAVYVGRLDRLTDGVDYELTFDRAWTDPARLSMIPLPLVEPQWTTTPPPYAVFTDPADDGKDASSRQLSVVEGSAVKLALACRNKALQSAQITIDGRTFPLVQTDEEGRAWQLQEADTPLAEVHKRLAWEIRVVDADGLELESPIQGIVRLKSDQKPKVTAGVVTQYVLPSAAPSIEYGVNDDFGLSDLSLAVEVLRDGIAGSAVENENNGVENGGSENEDGPAIKEIKILSLDKPLLRNRGELPRRAAYKLDLTPLSLAKGDKVRVTLRAVDYRGNATGQETTSDPLTFYVTDLSGVLAASAETDKQSIGRINAIIQRQLGIGETK